MTHNPIDQQSLPPQPQPSNTLLHLHPVHLSIPLPPCPPLRSPTPPPQPYLDLPPYTTLRHLVHRLLVNLPQVRLRTHSRSQRRSRTNPSRPLPDPIFPVPRLKLSLSSTPFDTHHPLDTPWFPHGTPLNITSSSPWINQPLTVL
jgi:hypothetical protein